jgi:hypothetical protein
MNPQPPAETAPETTAAAEPAVDPQAKDDAPPVLNIQDGPVDNGGRPWTGPPPK